MSEQQPSNGNGINGNRTVTNWELKLMSQDITHKIDNLASDIGQMNVVQAETALQAKTNSEEIAKLRAHHHEIANKVTPLVAILSVDVAREMTQLLPYVRDTKAMTERRGLQDVMTPGELAWVVAGARELPEDAVKRLADDAARRIQRESRWFGMSREVLVICIGGVFIVFNSPTVAAIWHGVFH